jgi:hypothetical protein
VSDMTIEDAAEIYAFLHGTSADVIRWLPGAAWEPAWQSEAAREVGNSETGSPGQPWGDAPVRTAYATAAVFIFAAVDSLNAIADSVSVFTTAYVPNILARAAMEAGGQAMWLLEPGIGARVRVIRSILIRASSARKLGQAVRTGDPSAPVTDYGEDQDRVRAYAQGLGLTYISNDDRTECEGTVLPRYTARAAVFEQALQMSAAYKIYSGAAHAELYSVLQSWRPTASPGSSAVVWERRPEREAVWAAVIAAAGMAVMPAFRAITLLGRHARRIEVFHSMRRVGELTRRMGLPRDWAD